MEITKYELTKKGKYNVYLANGEVLTLDERVITKYELLFKKVIDKELYECLNQDNKIYELLDGAIKYISFRLRSTKEIYDYLKKKENDIDVINEVIRKLEELKYLDDDKFTKAYINDKIKFTSIGDYKMRMELQRLGVDSSIIEKRIEEIPSEILKERMKKIIDKDIRTNKKYSGLNLKNKIYNHLVSSGYSKEMVISILNNYNF